VALDTLVHDILLAEKFPSDMSSTGISIVKVVTTGIAAGAATGMAATIAVFGGALLAVGGLVGLTMGIMRLTWTQEGALIEAASDFYNRAREPWKCLVHQYIDQRFDVISREALKTLKTRLQQKSNWDEILPNSFGILKGIKTRAHSLQKSCIQDEKILDFTSM